MMKFQVRLVGLLLLFSNAVLAAGYQLDEQVSSVSFATIKKEYVVEPASISTVSGKVSLSGVFNFNVALKGIKTGIPIRDTRLNQLFFKSSLFPSVKVMGQFDLAALNKAGVLKADIPATVSLYGHSKKITFPLTLVKAGGKLVISSTAPVIINASDFGIPLENLTKLAATVGGIPISNKVPVTVSLVLNAMK